VRVKSGNHARKDIFADPESQPTSTLLLTQKHTPAQQTGLEEVLFS
jgi:hypothetical protein